jgi:hypothetical protein
MCLRMAHRELSAIEGYASQAESLSLLPSTWNAQIANAGGQLGSAVDAAEVIYSGRVAEKI